MGTPSFWPGKMLRLERTFVRAAGEIGTVNPTIAALELVDPAGESHHPVLELPTYSTDGSSATFVARFLLPLDARPGTWAARWTLTGGLRDAHEEWFTVNRSLAAT